MKLINDYLVSPTHRWWVDNVWRPSWTAVLTWIYGLPAALVAAGQAISTLANDNKVQDYLAQMHVPDWVPVSLAVIALLHYVAHGRE